MKQILFGIAVVLRASAMLAESSWEDHFERANAAHVEGRHQAAEGLYRSALKLYRQSGETDDHLPVLLNNLASECQILRMFDEAETLYKQAVTEWRRFPDTPNSIGRILVNLAGLYRTTSRYSEAQTAYREALKEIEHASGSDSVEYAAALAKTADLHRSLGNWEAALPMAERAVRIASQHLESGDPSLLGILQVLACIYIDAGRLDAARKAYERTRITVVKAGRAQSLESASAFTGLGRIASLRGEFSRAEPLYRQAGEVYEQILGPHHPLLAVALNNLGQAIRHQQRYQEAEPFYARALGIFEAVPGADSVELAACLANFADFHHVQGHEGQAAAYLTRSVSILQSKLGENHRDVALLRIRLANVRQAQRNYVEAVRLYRLSLPGLTQALGAEDPRVVESASAYRRLLKEANAYLVMLR